MKRTIIVAAAFVAMVPMPAAGQGEAGEAEGSSGGIAAANEAYFAGDFGIAVARYEAVVDSGVIHEDLFYNLGNAYYRAAAGSADKLGRAIFNYERALRLAPAFEDARFNLDVARAAVAAKIADRLEGAEGDPFWIREATRFSLGTVCLGLAVAVYLFFGALIASRYQTPGWPRGATVTGAIVAAGAALLAGLLLSAQLYFQNRVDLAIVLPDEIELREAPDPRSSERGLVHAGLRVRLVDREPGWLRVRLANGHEGWLSTGSVGEL